ncbi:hypothetical protein E2F50_03935 [Rhizobium deserti]|uniref:Uncharacterized protein n=1 Tax=Rhizobium deserti TaxID=2547961 RepID=A0A4R5UN04_9HYPH|nr:hypothetical protein [Rhizobium deserti]TDK39282.1 hypothetical protein E2F50_03935 [Rhizobium deserti]
MIQFALLFGLGFLSAALLAMLVAPAIHRRIVRYTEKRIQATLPISPQEVRAQRDMARAVYAAENARSRQELVRERERATALQLRADALADEVKRMEAEKAELKMQIDNLDVEASDARSRLREEDSYIQQLKAVLQKSEEAESAQALEIDALRQQLLRLNSDADNFRIDLSARDTETENLKLRVTTLRDERESLRNDIRVLTSRAKDAEMRLAQEEQRAARLDEKLTKEIAERTDKEMALNRRVEEIVRLREKLKAANGESRGASRTTRGAGSGRTASKATNARRPVEEAEDPQTDAILPDVVEAMADDKGLDSRVASLSEEARNRATALAERLLNSKNTANDEALRQEMAVIAASMVAVTAAAEGKLSPIHAMLAGKSGSGDRESLAARAKKMLASTSGAAT